MSSVTRKIINRDSNKQTYRTDDSYEEQMRRPTERDAAILDKFRKESEFVKPYASDSYEEMEYGFIEPWDFGQWNDLSFPDVKWATPILEPWKLPPTEPDDPKEKCDILLYCFQEACYCPGSEKCTEMKCSQRVVSIRIKTFIGGNPPVGFSVSRSGNTVCITAPSGATETVRVEYLLEYICDNKKFYEWIQGQAWISPCSTSKCCDIAWDDAASADTVARNASCTVAITDSKSTGGPYAWSVSGTDFSLAFTTTSSLTNTLNAGASACGTATITVTGCGGATVTGYVLCTTGSWQVIATCSQNGGSTSGDYNVYYDKYWEHGHANCCNPAICGSATTCCSWPIADYGCTTDCPSRPVNKSIALTLTRYEWKC